MTVVVVGATGLVGRVILELLETDSIPSDQTRFFASRGGRSIRFRGAEHPVHPVSDFRPAPDDLVLTSTPDEAAHELVPGWLDAGARVVDESAAFRHDPRAVLVVPGVNEHQLTPRTHLVAGPNCTTIQIALALAPLHRAFGIEEVVVSTYQAASGAGRAGLRSLRDDTDHEVFGRQLRGDLIPAIGRMTDGHASEETKLAVELPKLLEADVPVHATCVRVPVEVGHAASLWVRTTRPPDDAVGVLEDGYGLRIDDGAPGPRAVAGTDDVIVSRVRSAGTNALSMWCVADNLRVGAALNAVRIASILRGFPADASSTTAARRR